jgi:hypothetical protein
MKQVAHALYYLFTGLSLLSICLFLASELLGIQAVPALPNSFGGIVFIFLGIAGIAGHLSGKTYSIPGHPALVFKSTDTDENRAWGPTLSIFSLVIGVLIFWLGNS